MALVQALTGLSFEGKMHTLRGRPCPFRVIWVRFRFNPGSEGTRMILLPCFRNCENVIRIAAMEELSYRQSRLCRLLGNPIAFTVVRLLVENKEMSTGEIAKAIHRSIPRTSNILAALRLAEVVRYETPKVVTPDTV
jgi:hypothetical protein